MFPKSRCHCLRNGFLFIYLPINWWLRFYHKKLETFRCNVSTLPAKINTLNTNKFSISKKMKQSHYLITLLKVDFLKLKNTNWTNQILKPFPNLLLYENLFDWQHNRNKNKIQRHRYSETEFGKNISTIFTTKPTGEGNSVLGLSLAYDIIIIMKRYGGELKVGSIESVGSEFIVILPS